VYRLKKWKKPALVLFSLFAIFGLTTGCFGGLDESQKTAATYVNSIYAKTNTPTAELRYQKIVSVFSPNAKQDPSKHKEDITKIINEATTKGLTQPYYIADHPSEVQSDTRRSVVVRIPLGTFPMANSNKNKDNYLGLIIAKEGSDWKIIDINDVDSDKLSQGDLEWKEVSPTDYMD
jgi:hypothetical protein